MTIYFDIDGVLARFTCAALKLHGRKEHSGEWASWNQHHGWGITDRDFYARMDRQFWAGLDRWQDGFAFLRYVETVVGEENIVLLTSPVETEGCCEGKRDWVKKHLPEYLPRLVIGGAKDKLASRTKVLVDDSDSNIEKFIKAGGSAWLLPRPWNNNRDLVADDGTFSVLDETKAFHSWYKGLN